MGTNPTYYAKLRNVKFLGVPAMDMPSFYIRPYLRQAADFINNALKEGGERTELVYEVGGGEVV